LTAPSAHSAASSALFTDFYSLTMAQGYWLRNRDQKAVFEMYYRRQPFAGGYAIFAGLGTFLENLVQFSFSDDDIAYLADMRIFTREFIAFLEKFRFTGSVWAMAEGTVVFPGEPLLRIEGGLIECQIIEGLLLNTINYQSLIATKTRRVWLASAKGVVMEFGLRRCHGPDGALTASRAAYIGGASGTSNTLAGKAYGIPVRGTMAHSWVMSFPDEESAFNAYARIYPDTSVFLVDTYDTLKSGIPGAIVTGKKLKELGKTFGVRLDSGDVHYLSVEARRMLDEAGLSDATITASNDLDESIIETLVNANAPVDAWGVGTQLVTGGADSAFTGVYKLAACQDESGRMIPVMKFSDNPEKTSNPGIKQVWRITDSGGGAVADVISLDNRDSSDDALEKGASYTFWHPQADYRHFGHHIDGGVEPLLKKYMEQGRMTANLPSLDEIREYSVAGLECFDLSYKRLLNPHVYKVSITEKLRSLKLELIKKYLKRH
jgi:nicotinate phosphoribosyltransferase